jgi:tetratricopeptide (TPR) repeat protein
LGDRGRLEEALGEVRQAQTLDPLSPIISAVEAWVHYCARRYDQAIEQCEKALELDSDFGPAHYLLALVYLQQDKCDQALNAAETAARLSKAHPSDLGVLGIAYARAGRKSEALETLRQLEERPADQPVRAWAIGVIHLALGEQDAAVDWLNEAIDRRDALVTDLKVNPLYDPLRSHPRFNDLLRRLGLEP